MAPEDASTPPPDHDLVIRQEFARQAPTFAADRSWFGSDRLARWMAAHVPLQPDDIVVDVCGGAGHVARRLASHARQWVVLDLTDEMLVAGAAGAAREGTRNVLFVRGDATAMPFVACAFDVAISRFALHHLVDPAAAVREMTRVVRPRGYVAVLDMVAGGARQDELERLRDPSHRRTLRAAELTTMLTAAGLELRAHVDHRQALPAEPWIRQARPPEDVAQHLLALLDREASGGERTGLESHYDDDGVLSVAHRWSLLVARRRGADDRAVAAR